MDRVRIGIIGTGNIARHHVRGYAHSGKADVVAAADINGEALNAFCEEFQIPNRYADYKELLADDRVDAVSVCLPPFLHAPVSIDAAKAGKHVLCEKPMCLTVEEGERMVRAAKEAGTLLMIHYRRRFLNASRKAKEVVGSGQLGSIYFSRIAGYRFRGRPNIDLKGCKPWFNDPAKAGAGVLFDLGGYALDLLMWLLGFPELKSVSASTYREIDKEETATRGFNVDELAVGMIRFANGATSWLESASAVNMDPAVAGSGKLFGDKAGLDLGPLAIYRPGADGKMETVRIETERDIERAPHMLPPTEFASAIVEGRPVSDCSGAEGLYVQRILNGMLQSAQEGKEVML